MSTAVDGNPSGVASAVSSASHAYLGALEDVQHPHHAYFADGDVVMLPLIYLPDIVRAPSERVRVRHAVGGVDG